MWYACAIVTNRRCAWPETGTLENVPGCQSARQQESTPRSGHSPLARAPCSQRVASPHARWPRPARRRPPPPRRAVRRRPRGAPPPRCAAAVHSVVRRLDSLVHFQGFSAGICGIGDASKCPFYLTEPINNPKLCHRRCNGAVTQRAVSVLRRGAPSAIQSRAAPYAAILRPPGASQRTQHAQLATRGAARDRSAPRAPLWRARRLETARRAAGPGTRLARPPLRAERRAALALFSHRKGSHTRYHAADPGFKVACRAPRSSLEGLPERR